MQRRERRAAQPAERTDGVLVGQALAGDERAFESLVYRYDASLFACIYRYMGDYDQACNVLQDVWLQLYRSLPTLRTVVLLRYAGQLSFAEIGRVLQMPATTAKAYFYRACPRLAAMLIA